MKRLVSVVNMVSSTTDQTNDVAQVDVVRWLTASYSEDDFVVLKMDIEGAEYILLENEPEALRQTHMLVEWHPHEWDGKPIPEFKHWKKTMVMSNLAYLEPLEQKDA